MSMTHYMQLLADNQPWNLIIFMAIPVILAETLAIAELYLLFTRKFDGIVHKISRIAGIFAGAIFTGIIVYLVNNAVIPITKAGEWRTVIDIIAVYSYLLAGLPLIWIALQEIGVVCRKCDKECKLKAHATCIALFLVLAHVAMIAGMLNPDLLTQKPQQTMMQDMKGMNNMPAMSNMPGMGDMHKEHKAQ